MKQQLIVSGVGGQGVLFVTRLLGHAGMEEGYNVLTSETHGMAMRGGTVISHVKIGPFMSPLVREGQADTGLFLHQANLVFHGGFVKPGGYRVVNSHDTGDYIGIDATRHARALGSLVVANLILLGCAVRMGTIFCGDAALREAIKKISDPRHLETNLLGFERGYSLV